MDRIPDVFLSVCPSKGTVWCPSTTQKVVLCCAAMADVSVTDSCTMIGR